MSYFIFSAYRVNMSTNKASFYRS